MLIKRSFALAGHRTSVALEQPFWTALEAMAQRDGVPVSTVVARVDGVRVPGVSLASALRVHCLHAAPALGEDAAERLRQ